MSRNNIVSVKLPKPSKSERHIKKGRLYISDEDTWLAGAVYIGIREAGSYGLVNLSSGQTRNGLSSFDVLPEDINPIPAGVPVTLEGV